MKSYLLVIFKDRKDAAQAMDYLKKSKVETSAELFKDLRPEELWMSSTGRIIGKDKDYHPPFILFTKVAEIERKAKEQTAFSTRGPADFGQFTTAILEIEKPQNEVEKIISSDKNLQKILSCTKAIYTSNSVDSDFIDDFANDERFSKTEFQKQHEDLTVGNTERKEEIILSNKSKKSQSDVDEFKKDYIKEYKQQNSFFKVPFKMLQLELRFRNMGDVENYVQDNKNSLSSFVYQKKT